METLPFQASLRFSCASIFTSSINNKQRRLDVLKKSMHDRFSTLSVKRLQRRLLLQFIGYNSALIGVNKHPVFAAPLPEMKEPEVIRTLKLANGVKFQDIVEGKGPEAREGDLVEVNYVCRRSNGYFVHSTVDQFSGESAPVILPLDENKIIKGLKEVLLGMKVGGKRRALIPPSVGYVNANLNPIPEEFGPRRSLLSHANEPLIFEVQLLKVL
ncbi:peptidyl-prolyl cis-trans isomerase FKBP16-1, chloroplastic-like isoform X1 [Mangifera indica]|uniref:peptidyl-prolyl cis-trans isomerase FKBP16-1, chloroplastic-like isoform X1 n=2 Tax=Mangifera indica TaxID=29780 RepID=UPI001CFBD612|nr:peptidyl-prolyl cis-trans isomerase FKBP16-1, chloroplastic-like isoform X1 [Mangifera indica]